MFSSDRFGLILSNLQLLKRKRSDWTITLTIISCCCTWSQRFHLLFITTEKKNISYGRKHQPKTQFKYLILTSLFRTSCACEPQSYRAESQDSYDASISRAASLRMKEKLITEVVECQPPASLNFWKVTKSYQPPPPSFTTCFFKLIWGLAVLWLR